jgi:hypothetical protein
MSMEMVEKYLIMKDDDVFNVELILRDFGDFYRVILIDSVTEEILISKLFEDEKEAITFFRELESKLKEIKGYILDKKNEKASELTKKFLDFAKSLEEDVISVEDLKVDDEKEDEVNKIENEAFYIGSLNKNAYYFDLYEKDGKIKGILYKGKDVTKLKKIKEFTFNDLDDAHLYFENLK